MTEPENLTPAHLRCVIGNCPSIHRLEDGRLLVVGRIASLDEKLAVMANGALWNDDEAAVIISPELLGSLKAEWVSDAVAVEREECAKIADYWGSGAWRVQHETRSRFSLHDMQSVNNHTGRAVAEDIRARTTLVKP